MARLALTTKQELRAAPALIALARMLELTTVGLHQAIQDAFFAAGVEICSPHFAALRDGNTAAIPADQRPEGYRAPAFRIARDPG